MPPAASTVSATRESASGGKGNAFVQRRPSALTGGTFFVVKAVVIPMLLIWLLLPLLLSLLPSPDETYGRRRVVDVAAPLTNTTLEMVHCFESMVSRPHVSEGVEHAREAELRCRWYVDEPSGRAANAVARMAAELYDVTVAMEGESAEAVTALPNVRRLVEVLERQTSRMLCGLSTCKTCRIAEVRDAEAERGAADDVVTSTRPVPLSWASAAVITFARGVALADYYALLDDERSQSANLWCAAEVLWSVGNERLSLPFPVAGAPAENGGNAQTLLTTIRRVFRFYERDDWVPETEVVDDKETAKPAKGQRPHLQSNIGRGDGRSLKSAESPSLSSSSAVVLPHEALETFLVTSMSSPRHALLRRASILEELIAVNPNSAPLRLVYATSLVLELKRHHDDSTQAFLERELNEGTISLRRNDVDASHRALLEFLRLHVAVARAAAGGGSASDIRRSAEALHKALLVRAAAAQAGDALSPREGEGDTCSLLVHPFQAHEVERWREKYMFDRSPLFSVNEIRKTLRAARNALDDGRVSLLDRWCL